jgi:hypothetical protein
MSMAPECCAHRPAPHTRPALRTRPARIPWRRCARGCCCAGSEMPALPRRVPGRRGYRRRRGDHRFTRDSSAPPRGRRARAVRTDSRVPICHDEERMNTNEPASHSTGRRLGVPLTRARVVHYGEQASKLTPEPGSVGSWISAVVASIESRNATRSLSLPGCVSVRLKFALAALVWKFHRASENSSESVAAGRGSGRARRSRGRRARARCSRRGPRRAVRRWRASRAHRSPRRRPGGRTCRRCAASTRAAAPGPRPPRRGRCHRLRSGAGWRCWCAPRRT